MQTQTPSLLSPGRTPVAWGRDAADNPVRLFRGVGGLTHVRSIRDERLGADGRRTRIPVHSIVRDVQAVDGLAGLMRAFLPDAAQIVEDFDRGDFRTREDAIKAEERYHEICKEWRDSYIRSRRRDADGLFLQLETVFALGKMLEVTYAVPTIEDAFPISILNTVLEMGRGIEYELVEELAAFGTDVSISGLPTANMRRGERFYNLVHIKAGAEMTDTEIRKFQEIARNHPDEIEFDVWDERLRGAALMVQRAAGRTIAFGRPQNEVPGLFRNSTIPSENIDFTTGTPGDNLAAITTLLANQYAAVNSRDDLAADSLAMSPTAFRFLSSQLFNVANASNVFTMEMIMRGNPWIKNIYQIREAQPSATDAAMLVKHGMDATEAAINSGGIRISGTQRNAIVAYRRDPKLVEILKGFDIETTIYPPVNGRTSAKVIESVGGIVVHQPATIRIGYEDAV